jgi:hypothetical protein
MNPLQSTLLFIAIATTAGCASSLPPATNTPDKPWTIKLTEAPLLASVDQAGLKATYELNSPQVPHPILFAAESDDAPTRVEPKIIVKIGGQWRIASLPASEDQNDFVYVGVCPARHEIFAILDCAVEDPGQVLDIIHSTDGGVTWSILGGVGKPTYMATFSAFHMDARGHGRLTVSYGDDLDQLKPGDYHYDTADGGKSWTRPTFEGDDLQNAEPVGEMVVRDRIKFRDAIKQLDDQYP